MDPVNGKVGNGLYRDCDAIRGLAKHVIRTWIGEAHCCSCVPLYAPSVDKSALDQVRFSAGVYLTKAQGSLPNSF